MHSTSLLLAAVALGLSAVAPPTQTNQPQTQLPIPVLQSNTRAVAVDVVVTKGLDQPIGGLHKQDFQLLEDGKPQSIDFFEEHTAVPAPSEIKLAPMPPNVFTNVPAAPSTDSVNVLLLDTLNTDREDQTYIQQQVREFLKTMQPNMQIAIFALGSKLRFIQGFTTDRTEIQTAFNDKKYGASIEKPDPSRALQDKQEDVEQVGRLKSLGMSQAGIEALQSAQIDFANYQADQRVTMTLEALQQLARYLAGIPGRKNLIWFSSSFPVSVFPAPSEKQSFSQTRNYTVAVKETADLLTLSKIAVYPVGAEGLMLSHIMEPRSAGAVNTEGVMPDRRSGASTSERPGNFMTPYVDEAAARATKMAAMEQLAADTGGKAIFNANDLAAATARAINNGAHYYTIVYTPTDKKLDGQYRRIEVKLTEGKYKLAYRRGYYADDTGSQPAMGSYLASRPLSPNIGAESGPKPKPDPLTPLMNHGMPSASQILYGVRILPAAAQPDVKAKRAGYNTKLTGPSTRYIVDFLIDSKKIQLQTMPDGKRNGAVRVELIAYDHDGKPLNWIVQTLGLSFDPANYAAIQHSGIPAHLEIDIPNADVYLATGIYDFSANKAGTLEIPLEVRAMLKAQATFDPSPSK
jgi:VWFA-related protein